jgi:uncharacterized protein (TIGR03067 family)
MLKSLGTLGLSLLVVALASADDAAKLDADKLVGDWNYVAGVRAGEKLDKERLMGKVTFTKDKTVLVPAGPDQKFVMAFKIDASASPAKIDLEIKDGPVKEGKAEGLIELKDGELKLIYTPAPGKRPAKFESTKENEAFFFTLKKAS